jgi:glycosyltransferase involved in cell wall biosynthesis
MGMSLVNLADERRWDTQQRAAAEQVARVLVCSEVDVMRSGCENAVVIANGYSLDWKPAAHDTVHDPEHPVLLFVGALGYAPNMDAIGWMATAVMPKILERIPGARLRVVGRNGEAVAQYDSLPGVEIIGHVESLEAELVAADVSVVPIRSGAGTRLKVVEAMANRLPMVSTTLGCEGIDVAHGRELLIGDTDQSFADGVVEMVRNDALRKGLIEAAEARYNEKYRWSTIRHNLATLAKTVVDEAAQA